MNHSAFFYILGFASLLGSNAALAQFPTPTPFVDVHPYQSQSALRILGSGVQNGLMQAIPAVTVKDYYYWTPGIKETQHALNTALLYDKRNPLPALTLSGANYSFYEGGYMTTLSADGFLNFKGKSFYTPGKQGGVYFLKQGSNEMVVIDSYGFFFDTFTPVVSPKFLGGNFIIENNGALTTIKSVGMGIGNGIGMVTRFDVKKPNFNFSDATAAGGNYFTKADNSVVTISSVNGQFSSPYTTDAHAKLLGGNYFIGLDDILYTVAADGTLKKNPGFPIQYVPVLMGYSFLKFSDGTFIVVDGDGVPHSNMIHVSPTGIDVELSTQLSDSIDPKSIYLPRRQ